LSFGDDVFGGPVWNTFVAPEVAKRRQAAGTVTDHDRADSSGRRNTTLSGWTSPRIAEAFGVREDTVRLWRSDFARGGVEALETSPAPGPAPIEAEAALRIAAPLLDAPVADRHNWTLARLDRGARACHRLQIPPVQVLR
jgi:Helix-turn-helix domain